MFRAGTPDSRDNAEFLPLSQSTLITSQLRIHKSIAVTCAGGVSVGKEMTKKKKNHIVNETWQHNSVHISQPWEFANCVYWRRYNVCAHDVKPDPTFAAIVGPRGWQ
jgi:hypothetical protein